GSRKTRPTPQSSILDPRSSILNPPLVAKLLFGNAPPRNSVSQTSLSAHATAERERPRCGPRNRVSPKDVPKQEFGNEGSGRCVPKQEFGNEESLLFDRFALLA